MAENEMSTEKYVCEDCNAKWSEEAWNNLPVTDDGETVCDSCSGSLIEIEEGK